MESDHESATPHYKEIIPDNSSVSPYEVTTRVESPPPLYQPLTVSEMRITATSNRKWILLTVGTSLGTAVLVGIVVGIAVHTTGEYGINLT